MVNYNSLSHYFIGFWNNLPIPPPRIWIEPFFWFGLVLHGISYWGVVLLDHDRVAHDVLLVFQKHISLAQIFNFCKQILFYLGGGQDNDESLRLWLSWNFIRKRHLIFLPVACTYHPLLIWRTLWIRGCFWSIWSYHFIKSSQLCLLHM